MNYWELDKVVQREIRKEMDYSSSNRLISSINDLRRTICEIESDINNLVTCFNEPSLNEMTNHIKYYLNKKKYKINVEVCSNSNLCIVPSAADKLVEGIETFINNTKIIPIGMQINGILIHSVNRLLYDSDTDIITIELNIC